MKKSWTQYTYLVLMFLICSAATACAALDAKDWIKADVPQDIQQAVEAEDRVTVNEAVQVRKDYVVEVTRNLERLDYNIQKGSRLAALIDTVAFKAFEEFSPALAAAGPLGLFALSVGGLFMRRPGDKSRDEHEKEVEKVKSEAKVEGARVGADLAKRIK